MGTSRTVRARWVFPVAAPPIPGGTITIADARVVDVGRTAAGRIEDLGNVALIPGLVNAHTHLDLSDLDGPLGTPGIGLPDWIRLLMSHRRAAGRDANAAVARGLRESARLGTTLLGDIAQPDWPAEQFDAAQCDAVVFRELIAPRLEQVDATMELARQHIAPRVPSRRWAPGLSPHATYSVHPELLAQAVALSAAARMPLAFHLAESREELQWLQTGRGPFQELLESRGVSSWLRRGEGTVTAEYQKPLDYLRILSRAHRALVIHGNYLDNEEIRLLATHRPRMAVVYCPRTHQWFGHDPYPLEMLLAAGVRVVLGTDSRASAPDLSILAEMRAVARRHPAVPGHEVLRLGTLRGAAALGRDAEVGSIERGKLARLTVVALPEHDTADPHALLWDADSRPGTFL
jgi:aminodeoxyfutalosine deaminase